MEDNMRKLNNLMEGAEICLANSKRLLDDSKALFYGNSNLTCFCLTQLCLEELAKGFKLLEKEKKREQFTEDEWKEITTKGKVHRKKLEYLQEVEDKWTKECIGSRISWDTTTPKEDREKQAESLYNWRMTCLYVNYDFDERQWINPLVNPVFHGTPVYHTECITLISRAKTLLQVLASKLNETT
jgi:AbiV family abortive infection protein